MRLASFRKSRRCFGSRPLSWAWMGDYVEAEATAADVLFWTKANAAERGSRDPTAKVAFGAFGAFIS